MTDELLDCPFCGSKDIDLINASGETHAFCYDCEASTTACDGATDGQGPDLERAYHDAAEAWNTRSGPQLPASGWRDDAMRKEAFNAISDAFEKYEARQAKYMEDRTQHSKVIANAALGQLRRRLSDYLKYFAPDTPPNQSPPDERVERLEAEVARLRAAEFAHLKEWLKSIGFSDLEAGRMAVAISHLERRTTLNPEQTNEQ
ncbi:Lar family restriction alleviation protein [Henriciella sp.]|uniref:Lar family restriction alleviation protein n=1 Tax=Henriciella sp. TaxID=1968823 RepID=UPI0026184CBD|nr:Lar family restriction alleviation protein [Henriciella sp.]